MVTPLLPATGARQSIDERPGTQLHTQSSDPQTHRGTFGWTTSTGGRRKTHHRGLARVGWTFTLANTAYNLVRIPKLLAAKA
jgi:hypothetical protein